MKVMVNVLERSQKGRTWGPSPRQHFNDFPLKDIETEKQNLGTNIPGFAIIEIPENFAN